VEGGKVGFPPFRKLPSWGSGETGKRIRGVFNSKKAGDREGKTLGNWREYDHTGIGKKAGRKPPLRHGSLGVPRT